MAQVSMPKYLTGDPAAINDFIDKFDVRNVTPKATMPMTTCPTYCVHTLV